MKKSIHLWLLLVCYALMAPLALIGQTLENPVTASYLKAKLSKESPRLILTPAIEKTLRKKLQDDPLIQAYYQNMQNQAKEILEQPLLKRELEGFRLLFVSREMARRMGILCMIYRIDRSPEILARIEEEVKAVCAFTDWNPIHFLDVAEISFTVSIATDWVGDALSKETVKLAKTSLIEKGILPSYNEGGERMGWINGHNNWNTICHSGMIVAALAIADVDPELAAKTIARALDKITGSLREYAPDGAYPEGPSYWEYGTSYGVVASNVLTTALGTDFGISDSPGFMESANFRLLATAPSGEYFNFADSDGRHGGSGAVLLAWFAAKTGDALYFDKKFFNDPSTIRGTMTGPGLVWIAQFSEQKTSVLPQEWHGRGANPLATFRGKKGDASQFYLAVKGGKAQLSHGNMDAGSFVFDLNGVRWVLDPGNQRYYLLNKIGFQLSNYQQDSERWSLLTKGNQTHSTITVNDARFKATGFAPITDFKTGDHPSVLIDMSDIFEGHLTSLQRKFIKESDHSILIEDQFEINASTQQITWAIMTTADIVPAKNGVILQKDGKTLKLSILTPSEVSVSIISLDPPPLVIDKTIENLKRLEIRVPAYLCQEGKGSIQVRLSDE
ncbi:MAG: heparinase II/III family protein [Saprospiraceae bacterium]